MASKGGLTAAVMLASCALWASSAQAANTRAEWVAQVEPICQTVAPAASAASANVNAKSKSFARHAKRGSLKAFVRSVRALAAAIQAYANVDDGLTAQLEAVPPVAADVPAVSAWLQGRRNSTAFANSAAQGLLRGKFRRFFKLIDEANAAYEQGVSAVSGFGLNVCLTA